MGQKYRLRVGHASDSDTHLDMHSVKMPCSQCGKTKGVVLNGVVRLSRTLCKKCERPHCYRCGKDVQEGYRCEKCPVPGNIRFPLTGVPWTEKETVFLMAYWGLISMTLMCKRLARTPKSVHMKAHRLGLSKENLCFKTTWTIHRETGYSDTRIDGAANALGIHKYPIPRVGANGGLKRSRLFGYKTDDISKIMEYLSSVPDGQPIRYSKVRGKKGGWGDGAKPDCCSSCGTKDRPHASRGLCQRCYSRLSRARAKSRSPRQPNECTRESPSTRQDVEMSTSTPQSCHTEAA